MSAPHRHHPGDDRPDDKHPEGSPPTTTQTPGCWVLSREAVRKVDALAVERFGIPSIVLMENAAIGLRDRAMAMMLELGTDQVVILVGPGNNGGDGLALARHLHNAGAMPRILLTTDPDRMAQRPGDAAVNLAIVRKMRLPLERLDSATGAEVLEQAADTRVLIVDALLGTGLRDPARGVIRDTILHVNRLRAPGVGVLAVDLPSGLDCDTGTPAGNGPAIEADQTVTFVALKPGMLHLEALRWTGEVTIAGIGAPRELIEELGELVPDTRRGPRCQTPTPTTPSRTLPPPSSHGRATDRGE
ncbi:MAG: NAD(P)H-hydrate epimerase [Planctomycetota bacterium]|nr:NAD(P)H-hydrate epimerase [Planctomycetota bacterium]